MAIEPVSELNSSYAVKNLQNQVNFTSNPDNKNGKKVLKGIVLTGLACLAATGVYWATKGKIRGLNKTESIVDSASKVTESLLKDGKELERYLFNAEVNRECLGKWLTKPEQITDFIKNAKYSDSVKEVCVIKLKGKVSNAFDSAKDLYLKGSGMDAIAIIPMNKAGEPLVKEGCHILPFSTMNNPMGDLFRENQGVFRIKLS